MNKWTYLKIYKSLSSPYCISIIQSPLLRQEKTTFQEGAEIDSSQPSKDSQTKPRFGQLSLYGGGGQTFSHQSHCELFAAPTVCFLVVVLFPLSTASASCHLGKTHATFFSLSDTNNYIFCIYILLTFGEHYSPSASQSGFSCFSLFYGPPFFLFLRLFSFFFFTYISLSDFLHVVSLHVIFFYLFKV